MECPILSEWHRGPLTLVFTGRRNLSQVCYRGRTATKFTTVQEAPTAVTVSGSLWNIWRFLCQTHSCGFSAAVSDISPSGLPLAYGVSKQGCSRCHECTFGCRGVPFLSVAIVFSGVVVVQLIQGTNQAYVA